MERAYRESRNQDQYKRQIVNTLKGDKAFIKVDWTMKFIAMKFRENQAECFLKREINWHVCVVSLFIQPVLNSNFSTIFYYFLNIIKSPSIS